MDKKICFVGLGMMGYPMAARLVANRFQLYPADSHAQLLGKFNREITQANATTIPYDEIDIVITMLPDSDVVESVLFGEQGVASQLRDQAVVIDMSSSDPQRSKAV